MKLSPKGVEPPFCALFRMKRYKEHYFAYLLLPSKYLRNIYSSRQMNEPLRKNLKGDCKFSVSALIKLEIGTGH